jgi:hypothetical protein
MEADDTLVGKLFVFEVKSLGSVVKGKGIYVGKDTHFLKFVHVLIENGDGTPCYRRERAYVLETVDTREEPGITKEEYIDWILSEHKEMGSSNSKIVFDLGDNPEDINRLYGEILFKTCE